MMTAKKPACPPIPPKAAPIVAMLRRDVPRPANSPILLYAWRWPRVSSSFEGPCGYACPMGLHPRAKYPTPSCSIHFSPELRKTAAIVAFSHYWDNLPHTERAVRAAINLIWPKE